MERFFHCGVLLVLASGSAFAHPCIDSLKRLSDKWTRSAVVEWQLTAPQEAQIEALFEVREPSPQVLVDGLETLWLAKSENSNFVSRLLFRLPLKTALQAGEEESAEPQHNFFSNKVSLGSARPLKDPGSVLVASHELGHGWHRNTRPSQYFTPLGAVAIRRTIPFFPGALALIRSTQESHAIGAEWELLSRIPPAQRNQYLRLAERAKESLQNFSYNEQFIQALTWAATLSKKEYVEQRRKAKGYDVEAIFHQELWSFSRAWIQ
jgi:hypothetical protein